MPFSGPHRKGGWHTFLQNCGKEGEEVFQDAACHRRHFSLMSLLSFVTLHGCNHDVVCEFVSDVRFRSLRGGSETM